MLLRPDQRDALLQLARRVIRSTLTGQPLAPFESDDPELSQPAGCFVSLHELETHELRGCVGRLDATEPLHRAVVHAAQGVLEDPRFVYRAVTSHELPRLELEISVLSPLRPALSPTEFDLLNDGIYLIHEGRAGCFLPQVARETGWNKEQLLARLCTEKLGLPATAWRDPQARLMVFSTLVLGPEPFETSAQTPSRFA